ncbi:Glycerol-3-phosphate transporter [Pseudomonas synxantha]|uniref:Major facilitator family transporter n=2 Tax=Pseudomonas TaxID=286 RepID=A0AAX3I4F9_9PSED|nr:MFS transporter [Pseudomonas synxantha]AZE67927.1 Glycerol-3-phosphate transporter [Pseudomonas synxantha]AZE73691.1 Glycerol-3-phosphate transporter [Pseudomonas synxantha]AZE79294.1 Glycerol-3-phosphate transporter [Pseudomonas synxantha]KRP47675.1 MFS transporter [Pseudomonas synxantha]SDU16114.1 Sugar phosphate permease [Pseudomonas synxantha]
MNIPMGSIKRWRVQIFAITWLAYAAFYFTRKAFSVAKLGIGDDPGFPLDKMMMANLDGLYLAAYAVGQFTWGMLADRFGPRVVVLGGLLVSAAAALVMGTFATLPIFVTCMLIQGLAQSTGWSGLCKNLGSFFPAQQRGRVLGLWSSCYAFGGLVASPFAGWWAYTLIGSWHAAFISSAAVVAVVAVLFFMFQRNTPQDVGLPAVEPEPVLSAEEAAAEKRISVLEPLRAILRNRTVLTLGLAYFLLKPARYAILLWGPVIVYEQMPSVGKVGAAIVPTAFELAGLLGPVLIGLASDKLFGARRMPACVLSLLALTVALALFMGALHTGSVVLVMALLFVMGLTLYGPDSMISSTAAIDFGTAKAGATAAGFVNGCGSVGAILGGLLPGYFDTVTVFIVFAGAALFSSLVLMPYWNARPAVLAQVGDFVPDRNVTGKPLRT